MGKLNPKGDGIGDMGRARWVIVSISNVLKCATCLSLAKPVKWLAIRFFLPCHKEIIIKVIVVFKILNMQDVS